MTLQKAKSDLRVYNIIYCDKFGPSISSTFTATFQSSYQLYKKCLKNGMRAAVNCYVIPKGATYSRNGFIVCPSDIVITRTMTDNYEIENYGKSDKI